MRIDWHCICGDAEASHSSRPEGEECHGWCQKTERDCNGKGYRPIPHTDRTPAFSAILTEARRHYMPKAYTCDLSSDYRALVTHAADAPTRFIWLLRRNGTELYRLNGTDAQSLQVAGAGYDYWTGEGRISEPEEDRTRAYYWNGKRLIEVDYEQGRRILRERAAHHQQPPLWLGQGQTEESEAGLHG
jgi:hypothetical protein